ncbi:hypothetical protein K8M07_12370 [Schnuerera sp. xch1]|uniref:hypothetical protein n=1 Tax=Schnuerera sp. xch1 TaxID=2874283 RepID=UPI001CBD2C60|nr:hypothetical protein [Schnuerera sp. xch1]MBZ2176034.1 hypothetical protein [Schnuerera sp. xch1]
MYNSIVVRELVRIWNVFIGGYNNSILKKFLGIFKRGLRLLSKGSYTIALFTSDRNLLEESTFYTLYRKIVDLINKIIKTMRKRIENLSSQSFIYNGIHDLFDTEIQFKNTFCIFFLAFGMSIIVNNIVRGFYSGRSYLISILLIVFSLIGLIIGENYGKVLKGSYVFNFVKDIFDIDEEVDQWW